MPLPLKEIAFVAQRRVSIFYNYYFVQILTVLFGVIATTYKDCHLYFGNNKTVSMQQRLAAHEFNYEHMYLACNQTLRM